MNTCLLLLLTTHHLQAQLKVHGKIVTTQDFSDSESSQFSEFISTLNCPCYLLTDLSEEEFRLETIPHLNGKNKRDFLQRKFAQFYPDTPFHFAAFLQRQNSGRCDDEMLFCALTKPSLILPILAILAAQKIPLAGIFSVAHSSAFLIQNYAAPHLLLITSHPNSGLRVSYFKQHRLQLSRLTPINFAMSFADTVISETNKTYHYLKGLNLLPEGCQLVVYIIGQHEQLSALPTQLSDSTDMRFEWLTLNVNEQLFHALTEQKISHQYGNAQHLHLYTMWQLRRGIWVASLLVLIVSLLWTFTAILLADSSAQTSIAELQFQTQTAQQTTQAITRLLPQTEVAPTEIKTAVLTLRSIQNHTPAAQQFLVPLSKVLTQYSDIQLDELAWQNHVVNGHNFTLPAALAITLKAHFEHNANNYRTQFAEQNELLLALKNSGYQVSVLSRPLADISSSNTSVQTDARSSELLLKLEWNADYATQQK